MSEITEETNNAELTQEEKVELAKRIFSTLDVNNRAKFANWCHEEIEKDTHEVLKEKMQKMNSDLNSFLAKAQDKIINTGTKIYDGTNKMVNSAIENYEENKQKNEAEKLEDENPDGPKESFFD